MYLLLVQFLFIMCCKVVANSMQDLPEFIGDWLVAYF